MKDALENHEGTVTFRGKPISNLRFADDINSLAGAEKLAKLVERLYKAYTAYGMEISAEETKLMTNNTSGINAGINVQEAWDSHKLQVSRLPAWYSPG